MKNTTDDGNGTKADETNALFQNLSIAPSTLNDHTKFEINVMGNMTDCNFYIQDAKGDSTGTAFRMAYYSARNHSNNNKEFCTYIGSMLCAVVPGFRNSVMTVLNEICVKPRFISLPSQADEYKIVISNAPQLGWPSILVVFGYCILLLFNHSFNTKDDNSYNTSMSNRIREMKNIVRWDPSNTLWIPFDSSKAKAVCAVLDSHDLRAIVMEFLMNNSNHPDSQISKVCKYLITELIAFRG